MPLAAAHNPFRTECLEQLRFRFQSGDWPSFLQRLEAHGHRGCIVGPKGSGKTTLISELASHLGSQGVPVFQIQLSTSTSSLERELHLEAIRSAADAGSFLLVDGAEQLGWLQRRRLLKHSLRARGCVVTQHSHTAFDLPVLHSCHTSHHLLQTLVSELLQNPTATHHAIRTLGNEDIRSLFDQHRGNLREAMLSLYDSTARVSA